MLGVSTSGYYQWRQRREEDLTETQVRRETLKQKIAQSYHESLGTYGAPRIREDLKAWGHAVSERTVGRYLREMGLRAVPPEPYLVTTDSSHLQPVFEDLLQQDFEAEKPNQVWVSDITYIWTSEGWVYLAAVLDLYARKELAKQNHV